MYVEFIDEQMYFSEKLAKAAKLKEGSLVFTFKLKGEPRFGFHKATRRMAEQAVCAQVRKSALGRLYITPVIDPVRYMSAVMKISYRKKKRVDVKQMELQGVNLFIFG